MNREEEVRKQEKPATSVFSVTESEKGSLTQKNAEKGSLSSTESEKGSLIQKDAEKGSLSSTESEEDSLTQKYTEKGSLSSTESEEGSLALTDSKQSSLSLTELAHAGLDIPSPFSKEIFLAHQSIVGTRYLGGSDELVEDLKPGDRVSFVTEPDNRFDHLAVMALDSRGRKLGYIPRQQNEIIGSLLRAGKSIYGILPEKQPDVGMANQHTPFAIMVDLYMREFVLPEDLVQIPRQGYQGSYVVVFFCLSDLTTGENGINPADDFESIFAVKVINGEERDIFFKTAPGRNRADIRDLFQRFQIFSGYLPFVTHEMTERKRKALEEEYGVLLGIPFSNHVIDTQIMAKNHLPFAKDYSLQGLADKLGIEVHAESNEEENCRKIWKLYCRMERSELKKS